MEFYVKLDQINDQNTCWLETAWFDDEIGEWKIYIQTMEEMVYLSDHYGPIVISSPLDDFECPSISKLESHEN